VRLLTKDYLQGEGLSPSALQDYLTSPARFFAKRVLHLKEPEQARMLIGTSVHAGIAAFLEEDGTEESALRALNSAFNRSLMPRTSAYDQAVDDATLRLTMFIEHREGLGQAHAIEASYRTQKDYAGVMVNFSGKVDAVLEREGQLRIVDFKTSSSVKGHEEDFVLQLAFYDFLLQANGEAPTGASIIQVRTDGIDEFPVPLTDEAREQFLITLNEAVPEMLSGVWRKPLEASEYDDLLSLFT
jgi:RecB family exonuclease